MSLSEHIDETKPKSAWRAAAGAFVVTVAIAGVLTLDGTILGQDVSNPVTRVLFCAGAGVLPALLALLRRRRQ